MTSREATKEQKAQSEIMTKASDKYAEQSLLVSQMYDRVKKGRTPEILKAWKKHFIILERKR